MLANVLLPITLAALLGTGAPHHGAEVIGHSANGRAIEIQAYGRPAPHPDVLVFGCIHGTECAATDVRPRWSHGGPSATVAVVPNLNPDGLALGTRLNGRGVDLNRNFPVGWRPIGSRGDSQYSGPRPFSEPETRLAARLIRALRPEVTIWFHQEPDELVRAWGQSVPAARRYARLAGLPFYRMPWMAGTAPNWQNHRFPGTASFVVELPPGPLSGRNASRLGSSIEDLAGARPRNGDRDPSRPGG
jgi:protein MpaA